MRVMSVLVLLLLAACGRPLTPAETGLAAQVFGDSLQVSRVRLVESPLVGLTSRAYPVRPRTTCRERIAPPVAGPTFTARTAGMVVFNHIHISPRAWRDDYLDLPTGELPLGRAMFLLHELTHVWQWQNRAVTGYHPLLGGLEHLPGGDPYLWDPESTADFLSFGYEQQASMVEEYLCCAALDPAGARTLRLRESLSAVMPLGALSLPPARLPWPDAQVAGICS